MNKETLVHLNISSAVLLQAIAPLSSIVSGRQMVSMLNNLLFSIKEKSVIITASDLYTSVTKQVTAQASGDAKIAVPGPILIETLRNLPDQPLRITINRKNYSMTIHAKNGTYQIACENHVDFPKVPITENVSNIQVPVATLKKALKQTAFAAGKDEMYPNIGGVNIAIHKDSIVFAATDGHRLSRYILRQSIDGITGSVDFTIPTPSIQMLLQLLTEAEGKINVVVDKKHLFLILDNQCIVVTVLDEPFPDYENIIPDETPHKASIQTQPIQKALRLIDYYTSQATHEICLTISEKEINIEAENLEFANRGEMRIPCTYKGETMKIRLHARLFAEIIKNILHDVVIIHFQSPKKPIVVTPEVSPKDEDLLTLMMPIAPKEA